MAEWVYGGDSAGYVRMGKFYGCNEIELGKRTFLNHAIVRVRGEGRQEKGLDGRLRKISGRLHFSPSSDDDVRAG